MSEQDERLSSPVTPQSPFASERDLDLGDRRRGFGFGVVSFVSGLLGLVLIWTVLAPMVLSPLAAALGAIGVAKGRRSGTGIGLASAGLTLGLVSIALILFVWWGLAHETGG